MHTILYYTSNKEGSEFEKRVRDLIIKHSGGLPIISVSQKPIDFGENICVGEQGASGFNMFRQVLIGLERVKTPLVISAEADCFYPPEYFQFIPPKDNVCYRNTNTWVMPQWRSWYWQKRESATHAQVVGTKFYLDRLNKLFKGAPKWSVEEKNFPKERLRKEDVFDDIEYWFCPNPVVQVKTTKSMRHYTTSDRIDIHELPFWGKGVDFRKKYYGDK